MARKRWIWSHRSRYGLVEPGVHISYGTPTGGPVLLSERTWRNWNGFLLSTGSFSVWLYFRRRPTL